MGEGVLVMIQVSLRLYGVFRRFAAKGGASGAARSEILLELPPGSTLAHLKLELVKFLASAEPAFPAERWVDDSAFADSERVLRDDTRMFDSCSLALLPPVCGG